MTLFYREKITHLSIKMAVTNVMSQEEIIQNTRTVVQGLETLKTENNTILSVLLQSLAAIKTTTDGNDVNTRLMEEKACIIKRNIESIELGLNEANVMISLTSHLQSLEAEKKKFRAQIRRLCHEASWLREELANTQAKLQTSEMNVARLEEEKSHLEFMN